jgi:hypothetical protein
LIVIAWWQPLPMETKGKHRGETTARESKRCGQAAERASGWPGTCRDCNGARTVLAPLGDAGGWG